MESADPLAGATTPLRLHSKLLFYGLDAGTWSDPPKAGSAAGSTAEQSVRSGGHSASYDLAPANGYPWQHLGSRAPVWNSTAQNAYIINQADWLPTTFDPHGLSNMKASAEPSSTEEGSEPKGSESDSLPESSEGYAMPSAMRQMEPTLQPQVPSNLLPYLHGAQVPHGVSNETADMYSSYMSHDSFLAAHGFVTGSEAGAPYAFDPVAGFQQSVGPQGEGVLPVANGLPSIGSYAHLSGQCSRCCFHPKGRCANGYSCQFCHFDHDKRPRNGKKKRYRRGPDDMGEMDD